MADYFVGVCNNIHEILNEEGFVATLPNGEGNGAFYTMGNSSWVYVHEVEVKDEPYVNKFLVGELHSDSGNGNMGRRERERIMSRLNGTRAQYLDVDLAECEARLIEEAGKQEAEKVLESIE